MKRTIMFRGSPLFKQLEKQAWDKVRAAKRSVATTLSPSDEVAILKTAAAADRHARVVELCKRIAADPDATQAQRTEAAALVLKSAYLTGGGRKIF